MKKFMVVLIVMPLIYFGLRRVSESQYYPEIGLVTKIDNTVVFETENGNLFSFDAKGTELKVGDICSAVMHSNGTKMVLDDAVIKIKAIPCHYEE